MPIDRKAIREADLVRREAISDRRPLEAATPAGGQAARSAAWDACTPSIRFGVTFTPRAAWAETPEPVRTAVAEALGAAIVGYTDLHGGM